MNGENSSADWGVKSIATLSYSPNDARFSFILSIQSSLGLPLFLFPSNLACSALAGIRSIVILSIIGLIQAIGVFAGRLCLAQFFGYTYCLPNVVVTYFL